MNDTSKREVLTNELRDVLESTPSFAGSLDDEFQDVGEVDPYEWINLPASERQRRIRSSSVKLKSPLRRVRKDSYIAAFARFSHQVDAESFACALDITLLIDRMLADPSSDAQLRDHFRFWLNAFSKTRAAMGEAEAAKRMNGEDNASRTVLINQRLKDWVADYLSHKEPTDEFLDEFEQFHSLQILAGVNGPPGHLLTHVSQLKSD